MNIYLFIIAVLGTLIGSIYYTNYKLNKKRMDICIEKIPSSFINDNYCDCIDGTDEYLTSACNNGIFKCIKDNIFIPSSMVHDRICDCCDGSDEMILCPNVCDIKIKEKEIKDKKWEKDLKRILNNIIPKRIEIIEKNNILDKYINKKVEYSELFEKLKQRFELNREKMNIELNTEKNMQFMEQLRYNLQYLNYNLFLLTKLEETDYGYKYIYSYLIGKCFKKSLNEKQVKGGSSNMIAREYLYIICPFQNITQTEPLYHEWIIKQDEARGIIKKTNKQSKNIREEIDPILMGVWINEWNSTNNIQLYKYGEECSTPNGKIERSVKMKIKCGLTEYIDSIEENEPCLYDIVFVTPIACIPIDYNLNDLKYVDL